MGATTSALEEEVVNTLDAEVGMVSGNISLCRAYIEDDDDEEEDTTKEQQQQRLLLLLLNRPERRLRLRRRDHLRRCFCIL